jgi:hypothetical protein
MSNPAGGAKRGQSSDPARTDCYAPQRRASADEMGQAESTRIQTVDALKEAGISGCRCHRDLRSPGLWLWTGGLSAGPSRDGTPTRRVHGGQPRVEAQIAELCIGAGDCPG